MQDNGLIIYEQPLNEHVRVCLRIEHLLQKIQHNIDKDTTWASHAVLDAIIKIICVSDRPDLKGKLTQEMRRSHSNLAQLRDTPSVDHSKLDHILQELEHCLNQLHNTRGKLGDELRQNEFLDNVRQSLNNPGGTCSADAPAYHYWLNQPYKQRAEDLQTWISQLGMLQQTVGLLLELIRESATAKIKLAVGGFYQEGLDPQLSYQLVRIALPSTAHFYPEISIGRHRIAARFFVHHTQIRGDLAEEDIPFEISYCVL